MKEKKNTLQQGMGLCANNVVLRSEQEGNFPGSVAKTSRFR